MDKKKIAIIVGFLAFAICLFVIFYDVSKKPEEKKIEKFYLTEKYYNTGEFIKVDASDLEDFNKDSFILFTYNNFCIFKIPCDEIFQEIMSKDKIDVVSIPFSEFKQTKYYKTVKLAPSVMIIKNGEIVKYLDAESDEDFNRYQEAEEFEKWLDTYIYLEKEAN